MRLDHIYQGNAPDILKTFPEGSVQCGITSPPYWGLRDYGIPPQIWDADPECQHDWTETEVPGGSGSGLSFRRDRKAWHERGGAQPGFCRACGGWLGSFGLEPDPELYVQHAVLIFREVRRVLSNDGTLWLNLGDSYATGAGKVGNCPGGGEQGRKWILGKSGDLAIGPNIQPNRLPIKGLKPKDMVGIPWKVAFALQADGWYLRQDLIWNKPNVMPESVRDRCTKSHEYVFLLSKSQKYFYDSIAIREPASPNTHPRRSSRGQSQQLIPGVNPKAVSGWAKGSGSHCAIDHAQTPKDMGRKEQNLRETAKFGHVAGWRDREANTGVGWGRLSEIDPGDGRQGRNRIKQNSSFSAAVTEVIPYRNKRSVWTIPSAPYKGNHYATFPQRLVVPMVLAGTSHKGHCPKCGARWVRISERKTRLAGNSSRVGRTPEEINSTGKHIGGVSGGNLNIKSGPVVDITSIGWRPLCKCGLPPVPDIVLDPFGGVATTAIVAKKTRAEFRRD